MSQIQVTKIADSINPLDQRLTTFHCVIPKWLLAQVNTHRDLSRNAGSSRAIPLAKMREKATYTPEKWLKNERGMQASEVIKDQERISSYWNTSLVQSIGNHQLMELNGVSKQQANRLLEPFIMIDVLISATRWDNFLNLRIHGDAQDEMRELAEGIGRSLLTTKPEGLDWMFWHAPYIEKYGIDYFDKLSLDCSAARCARISIKPFDENVVNGSKDIDLANRLLDDGHLSPFEHVAVAIPGTSANYDGWVSLRKFYELPVKPDWKERINK